MDKYEIINRIEEFAPPELAEKWDCSGWVVETSAKEVEKIMLCLTVTDSVVREARQENCDLIISHHPLFCVPIEYKDVNIYSAHTNLDYTQGGTTDELVKVLGFEVSEIDGFLRYSDVKITLVELLKKLSEVSKNIRLVKCENLDNINRITFCSGSGSEFMNTAFEKGADVLVTGDVKFHAAVETKIPLIDIGHFESEYPILKVLANIISEKNVIFAKEFSPFKTV